MTARTFLPGIFLFLFFHATTSFPQIGLKGGLGICDIAFVKYGQTPYLGYEINDLEHRLPMLTYQVGAFGTFGLGKRFSFQPELLYARRGLDYTTHFLYDDLTYRIKIDYLQAPLLLRYKTSLERKRPVVLFAGPYLAWKLNAKRLTEVSGQRTAGTMPNVKNLDLGVIAGLAVDFNLPSGNAVVIEGRTSFSLLNMMKPVEGYLYNYEEGPTKEYARNVSISLLVGYRMKVMRGHDYFSGLELQVEKKNDL